LDIKIESEYDSAIMRKQNLGIVILAILLLPLSLMARGNSSEYGTLLSKLKAGDTSIDFVRLRLSYVDSPEHKSAKDTSDEEKEMFQRLNGKDFAKALNDAEKVLAQEYVNMDAHFVAYVCNQELGHQEKANFHRAVFRALVDSIVHSGDGKSPQGAWVVISVHEEYVVLRALGFQPVQQSLMNQNGHSYDVMKVKGQEGAEQTFYFNANIPMKMFAF
jgi:hypothetical protein